MSEIGRFTFPCNRVVEHLTASLHAQGLQVVRSFDLLAARRGLVDPESCPCPNHGTAQCNCQYVVLLVNQPGSPPDSIVAHGHGSHTVVSLPASEEGPHSQWLTDKLRYAMADLLAQE